MTPSVHPHPAEPKHTPHNDPTAESHDHLLPTDGLGSAVEPISFTTLHQPKKAGQWSATQVFLLAAIPLITLSVWLGVVGLNPRIFNTFAGEKIGGRFSLGQAKGIDVITGAILAPLFMAIVNYILFESARVSAVNEQGHDRAVPFRTLVAASKTSAGSYDLVNFRDLLQGRNSRLLLFALLTLFSAVSRSALSNVIAYQAYTEDDSSPLNTLRLQSDAAFDASSIGGVKNDFYHLSLYDFTTTQNVEAAKQMVALLTELSFETAAPRLSNGTYININATSQSLGALPLNVIKLHDVPASRLSVVCSPDLPVDSLGILQPLSVLNTQISLMLNTTTTSNRTLFQANYPGVPKNMQTGNGDDYSYVGFSLDFHEVYLGRLNRFNLSHKITPSIYGDVPYRAFNMSDMGFTGTQQTMSVSGIRCSLFREDGLANYTRASGANDGSKSWIATSAHFPENQKKVNIRSMLGHFQTTSLNFHAPGAIIGGLGPALDIKESFTDFATRFLYASGEAQRILYEVAALNESAAHNPPQFFVKVTGIMTQEYYRITYVPTILLVGLLCLLGASIVTGSMAMYVRKSQSAHAHRKVDAVRLIVDSVVGLRDHHEVMRKLGNGDNGELDTWASGFKVKYSRVEDEDGTLQVLLERQL